MECWNTSIESFSFVFRCYSRINYAFNQDNCFISLIFLLWGNINQWTHLIWSVPVSVSHKRLKSKPFLPHCPLKLIGNIRSVTFLWVTIYMVFIKTGQTGVNFANYITYCNEKIYKCSTTLLTKINQTYMYK